MKPRQEEPNKDPSGGILEVSTVIIGDDSAKYVISLEDLVVGQDVDVEDSDVHAPDNPVSASVCFLVLT